MTEFVLHLIKDLGLLCLLAVGLLPLRALTATQGHRLVRDGASGLLFGIVAAVVMLDPIRLPEGATFDPRAAPAILAGVYGGPLGAAVAAAIGAAARYWLVGGPFATGGAFGFLFYGAFGAAAGWYLTRRQIPLRGSVFLVLGGLGTLAVTPAFFIDADLTLGLEIVGKAWPMLLTANLVGTLAVGLIVERAQSGARLRELLKEAEAEARRLSLVARETTNAVVITDAQGRIEWVNEGFTRVSGYSANEAIGKSPGRLLQGPASDQATVARIRERLRREEGFEAELVNYTKDGQPYWIKIDCQPLREPGQPLRYVAIESDITERKELERRLLRAEHVGNMGHWVLDPAAGEIVWSTQTYRIFGLPVDGAIPSLDEVVDFYHPDDRPEVREVLETAIKTGEGFEFRLRLVTLQGLKWVDVRSECELGEDGRVRRLFGIIQDVTDFVQHEAELCAARDAADAASRVKSEFLATMSHELRTPLNAINGYSEIMSAEMFGPLGSERYRGYARDIHASALYLRELIEGVLELSSLEAGRRELALAPTPVGEVAGEVRAMVGATAAAKQVTLRTLIDPGAEVLADRRALKQMLINCIENSIKFAKPASGWVELRTVGGPGVWRIEIADNGHGIPADKLSRITEPFFRAHAGGSGRMATVGGTGIGLSLVNRYATFMGGHLEIASTEGVGTTIAIVLKDAGKANLPRAALRPGRPEPLEDVAAAG